MIWLNTALHLLFTAMIVGPPLYAAYLFASGTFADNRPAYLAAIRFIPGWLILSVVGLLITGYFNMRRIDQTDPDYWTTTRSWLLFIKVAAAIVVIAMATVQSNQLKTGELEKLEGFNPAWSEEKHSRQFWIIGIVGLAALFLSAFLARA